MITFWRLFLALLLLTLPACLAFAQKWTQSSAPTGKWTSVASSADGTKLIAAQFGGVYISNNSGITWTAVTILLAGNWLSVASSADGTKLVSASGQNQPSESE